LAVEQRQAEIDFIKGMGIAYDHIHLVYWRPTPDGSRIKIRRESLETYIKNHYWEWINLPDNYSDLKPTEQKAIVRKGVGKIIERIEDLCSVSYTGPLAGYFAGIHDIDDAGTKVLVTQNPKIIEDHKGDCPLIDEILHNMFAGSSYDDPMHFQIWLKQNRKSYLSHQLRPGPILILIGAASSCKSFVQDEIITPAFSGRSAEPTRFMIQKAEFNDAMFQSEHLLIGDVRVIEKVKNPIAGFIKELVGNKMTRCHPKEDLISRLSCIKD
jgi:hypothetical protein